jgi:7-cyano-7-deazaguanine reductase
MLRKNKSRSTGLATDSPSPSPTLSPAHLGQRSALTDAQIADPATILDTFPNPRPERDFTIRFTFPEFTSVCPITGQPDFATITLEYVPDERCVEMKSLKLYYYAFRNKGIFYEAVTNRIADDLIGKLAPRYLKLTADFAVRGGTAGTVTVEHRGAGGVRGRRGGKGWAAVGRAGGGR